MLDVYTDFAIDDAAIPVIPGRKSETEKFAGAVNSYTIEGMMGNTRALQAGTSHFLGQNFARAFEIHFLDQTNEQQFAWTTSWGLSTRFMGAIIMIHGDDQGLMLPPKLAPIQVVVVPIFRNDEEKAKVMPVVEPVRQMLADFRIKVDDRTELTPGFKFNDWEMRGVPLRLEDRPQGCGEGRRDRCPPRPTRQRPERAPWRLSNCPPRSRACSPPSNPPARKATAFRHAHIYDPQITRNADVRPKRLGLFLVVRIERVRNKVKEDTKATTRCIPLDQPGGQGKCIVCGEKADQKVYFARAY